MITEYTNNMPEWDNIVRSFHDRDIYWLSGYTKAFESHGDGAPRLLFYEDDGVRGINVVMKRDIARDKHFQGCIETGKYFDLSTAYGYGGWLFEGNTENRQSFENELNNWYTENNIVSIFYRFHPVLENASVLKERGLDIIQLGKTVAIELDDEQKIWERYSSKNRGHIRKAEKEGVIVEQSDSKEAMEIFKSIYKTTMNNDEADDYYYFGDEFYDSIRTDLDGQYSIFIAYFNDIPIAAAIMLFENRFITYHLSGQLVEYRKYAGTNMILHEAAKWGCQRGYEWLHLGGGLGAKEGPLYDFKKSFYKKGEDKTFYIGKKILNQDLYKFLMEKRNLEDRAGFFPRIQS